MDTEKIGYSVEEAAVLTHICRTKLYIAIKEGRLKAKKNDRRTLILREDLLEFMRNLPNRWTK